MIAALDGKGDNDGGGSGGGREVDIIFQPESERGNVWNELRKRSTCGDRGTGLRSRATKA